MKFLYLLDNLFIKQPRFRRFVTSLLERDVDVNIELAGTKLLVNARREHGYLRASRICGKSGTLRDEIPVIRNLFAFLRDGDTFVDVGANVGLFSHSVTTLCNALPNLQIVAIEANPDTFLRLSSIDNARVQYHNFAAGDKDGELEFIGGAVSHVFTEASKANRYHISGETVSINVKRLDSCSFPTNSLVLKIDVEGQEFEVLSGAEKLFELNRIRMVYIDGFEDKRIPEWLIARGFRLFEGRSLEPLASLSGTFSLLAIKQGSENFGDLNPELQGDA